jgi:hypothetical protein
MIAIGGVEVLPGVERALNGYSQVHVQTEHADSVSRQMTADCSWRNSTNCIDGSSQVNCGTIFERWRQPGDAPHCSLCGIPQAHELSFFRLRDSAVRFIVNGVLTSRFALVRNLVCRMLCGFA